VITVETAQQLALAGVIWTPQRGDHFVLPDRDMDEQVFVVSDMTIEVHRFPSGEVLGFNGTVEWALDSIERHEALWIPREDQLRALLGDAFAALVHVPGRDAEAAFVCELTDGTRVEAARPEDAYAAALLVLLHQRQAPDPGGPP
jgi:hypothetical protein